MAADPANERSLLDRLNALKPTSVTLDTSNNALNGSTTAIGSAVPPSREDALAERLRTLRNRRDGTAESKASADPPPPYTETVRGSAPSRSREDQQPVQPLPSTSKGNSVVLTPSPRTPGGQGIDLDGGDDRALDEILDGLVLEDDDWSMSEDGSEEDSKKVQELLDKLRNDPGTKPPVSSEDACHEPGGKDDKDDGDDSEGEAMSRAVKDVLARAMDELKLQGPVSDTPAKPPEVEHQAEEDGKTSPGLSLPEVPPDPTQLGQTPPRTPPLALPAVPTALVDPAPAHDTTGDNDDDPFESAIAARLAALKGGSSGSDAFGLPSAPTFQPKDRPVPGAARNKGAGYTDDDQKTWCIMCLDDATVRCLGCDGDVYCARCWREMHVGPAAGYDERGHKWDKFDARQR